MGLYVGTSGYSYKEWKGSFYPRDLPAPKMLHYYGERFGTVEINSSFFATPKASVLEGWADAVPDDFRFVLKATRRITHIQKLIDAGGPLSDLVGAAGALSERLGPLLFQLPPMLRKDATRLRAFLALLPSHIRAAIEFRHPSWFDDEIFGLLRDHRAALCIADADDDLDVPFVATADWGYLRLRRPDYGDAELASWTERVRGQGWDDAFVFFKHEDEGKGPRMAERYLALAGRASTPTHVDGYAAFRKAGSIHYAQILPTDVLYAHRTPDGYCPSRHRYADGWWEEATSVRLRRFVGCPCTRR